MKISDAEKRGILSGFWHKYFDRQETNILLPIVLIGFLLRLVYVVQTQGTPFFEYLFSDSEIYNNWALGIANEGRWIGSDVFFMAPVYPYILALFYKVFGDSIFIVRLFQIIVSSLNIFIIYLVGRNLRSRNVGYIAAAIASVYSVFIFYSGAILSETLQTFVVSILIYFISKDATKFDKKDWFKIGLLLGVSALFRGNILLFLPFVLVYLSFEYLKKKTLRKQILTAMLFLSIGTALPILPVTVRNYIAADELVLLTSNGGINFYLGNNPNAVGVFVSPKNFDFYSDLSGKEFAEKQLGKSLTASEVSSYWYGKGIEYLTDNPGNGLLLNIKKLFLFFSEGEMPQSIVMNVDYFEQNYASVLKLPLINFFFISLLSIGGMILYYRSNERNNLIYLFLAAYILGTIIFFVNGRFRLALTPLLIVLAAYTIYVIFESFQQKKYAVLKLPAMIVGLYVLIFAFVLDKPTFSEFDAYMHLGDIAYDQENFDNAIENYNRALFFQDTYMPYLNLGNSFARKKDFRNAISAFNKAIARNPEYYLAFFNLAFAYTQMGDMGKAEEAYKRTIELNPSFDNAYRNLGITYYVQEMYDKALIYFNRYLEISDDEITKESVRKDIENIERILTSQNKN